MTNSAIHQLHNNLTAHFPERREAIAGALAAAWRLPATRA